MCLLSYIRLFKCFSTTVPLVLNKQTKIRNLFSHISIRISWTFRNILQDKSFLLNGTGIGEVLNIVLLSVTCRYELSVSSRKLSLHESIPYLCSEHRISVLRFGKRCSACTKYWLQTRHSSNIQCITYFKLLVQHSVEARLLYTLYNKN